MRPKTSTVLRKRLSKSSYTRLQRNYKRKRQKTNHEKRKYYKLWEITNCHQIQPKSTNQNKDLLKSPVTSRVVRTEVERPFCRDERGPCRGLCPIFGGSLILFGTSYQWVPVRGDGDKEVVWEIRDTSELKTERVERHLKGDGWVNRHPRYLRGRQPRVSGYHSHPTRFG